MRAEVRYAGYRARQEFGARIEHMRALEHIDALFTDRIRAFTRLTPYTTW